MKLIETTRVTRSWVEKAKLNRKRGWIPLVHPPRSSVCESSKPCQVYRALNRLSHCSRRTNLSSSYCQPGLGEGTREASTSPFRAEISKGFGTINMPCFCIRFPYKYMLPPVAAGGAHTHDSWDHTSLQQMFSLNKPTSANLLDLHSKSALELQQHPIATPQSLKLTRSAPIQQQHALRCWKTRRLQYFHCEYDSLSYSLSHTHTQMRLQR